MASAVDSQCIGTPISLLLCRLSHYSLESRPSRRPLHKAWLSAESHGVVVKRCAVSSHIVDHVVRVEAQCLFDCCVREAVLFVSIIDCLVFCFNCSPVHFVIEQAELSAIVFKLILFNI